MGEIEEIIAAAPWRFAKTMPHIPHEYVVEGKSLDPVSFDALAAHFADNAFGRVAGPDQHLSRARRLALLGHVRTRQRVDQDHQPREAAGAAVEEGLTMGRGRAPEQVAPAPVVAGMLRLST
jgi:hypothetical protein